MSKQREKKKISRVLHIQVNKRPRGIKEITQKQENLKQKRKTERLT